MRLTTLSLMVARAFALPDAWSARVFLGKAAKASVVDLTTLKTISKIETGEGPDAMHRSAASGARKRR